MVVGRVGFSQLGAAGETVLLNSQELVPSVEKVRVVVVDDVDQMRKLIKRMLDRDGRFEVVGEAEDGRQGVEVIASLKPDLVFLDLMMPNMSGAEALIEIRSQSPESKILILSGFPPQGVAEQLDADAYLEKGATHTEIVAAAARVTGLDS